MEVTIIAKERSEQNDSIKQQLGLLYCLSEKLEENRLSAKYYSFEELVVLLKRKDAVKLAKKQYILLEKIKAIGGKDYLTFSSEEYIDFAKNPTEDLIRWDSGYDKNAIYYHLIYAREDHKKDLNISLFEKILFAKYQRLGEFDFYVFLEKKDDIKIEIFTSHSLTDVCNYFLAVIA